MGQTKKALLFWAATQKKCFALGIGEHRSGHFFFKCLWGMTFHVGGGEGRIQQLGFESKRILESTFPCMVFGSTLFLPKKGYGKHSSSSPHLKWKQSVGNVDYLWQAKNTHPSKKQKVDTRSKLRLLCSLWPPPPVSGCSIPLASLSFCEGALPCPTDICVHGNQRPPRSLAGSLRTGQGRTGGGKGSNCLGKRGRSGGKAGGRY